jgi:hypothetical protein
MPTAMTTRSFRSSLAIVATLVLANSSGCAGVGQRIESWCYGLSIRSQQHHELADVRQDTRVALAEQEREALRMQSEREIEQARLDAERQQLEMEFCRANQEALQRNLKRNVRETIESKVAFNVEQGLEVGELEVDVQELQALLKRREEQPPPPELPLRRKQPCPCCDAPCGCEPGMIRRNCPHCQNKPCEAERDCGGPEALRRLEELPLKRPLRPAEIPMKLPVRLNFGVQQPELEESRIRRVPNIELPLERRGPCDRCTNPANCPNHCTQPIDKQLPANGLNGTYDYRQPVRSDVPTVEPQTGPQPVPEAEARRLSTPPVQATQAHFLLNPPSNRGFAWLIGSK